MTGGLEFLATFTCPSCSRTGTVELGVRMVARPPGSFSLAGRQLKVSAVETPALVCATPDCGFHRLPSTD